MTFRTVTPGSSTDNPGDEEIAAALRQLYDEKIDAVILVADKKKNLFMQMGCGGRHIEYCVGPEGPIYSADDVPIELAAQMFLAYKRGDDDWKTAVTWAVEIEEL